MNTIEQYIEGEKNTFKKNIVDSFHAIRPKTESQEMLNEFRFASTMKFWFSLISWSLYIPFFIDLISKSNTFQDTTIILTALAGLTAVEWLLYKSANWWYTAKESKRKLKKMYLAYCLYILSILSVVFSGYSGMSGVISADKSEETIIKTDNVSTEKIRKDYFAMIEANNKKVASNNDLIKSYSGIALTKPAQKYITDLQAKNTELEQQNNYFRLEMNAQNDKKDVIVSGQISQANSKKWMFASIFLIVAVLMVVLIHYCAHTCAKYARLSGEDLAKGFVLSDEDNELKKALESKKLDVPINLNRQASSQTNLGGADPDQKKKY